MAYKMKGSGLPFKELGSSPAKTHKPGHEALPKKKQPVGPEGPPKPPPPTPKELREQWRQKAAGPGKTPGKKPKKPAPPKMTSPAKQLKEEYMRTPQEKAFYESSESKDFEPEPSGTYRGIGSYSKNKKTGEVISKGIAGSKPKKKVATSEKVGPVESPEALAKKKALAREEKKGPSGTIFDASDADWETDKKERAASREAQKYVKKK